MGKQFSGLDSIQKGTRGVMIYISIIAIYILASLTVDAIISNYHARTTVQVMLVVIAVACELLAIYFQVKQ
jgi:hypothetical protein